MNKTKPLGIYLHIPFCVKKCRYCDFLSAPAGEDVQRRYMEALRKDIADCAELAEGRTVDSVFFGGGTPSILPAEEIAETMELLRRSFALSDDAEITLEANPGTFGDADDSKPMIWRQSGVNRQIGRAHV